MANPRQRRKLKSASYHKVRTQKADKFKKHPPIKGPKVIQDAWDNTKTLLQNYQALGLAVNLSASNSGGVERPLVGGAGSNAPSSDLAPIPEQATHIHQPRESHLAMTNTNTNGLRKGFGRIVRDDDGNVIRVEMPEEDRTTEMSTDSPSGVDEVLVSGSSGALSTSTPLDSANKTQKTEVIEELEKLANRKLVQPRYASQHEMVWLRSLVQAHGDDLNQMARDRRLNVWQKTAGEIRRA
ncbi:Nucleolar protein 16 [Tulasnella sp. 419]|nr:Nucleolar protein 16 [Tulasnella sp. 419]